jgi:hypothetical protein
MKSCEDIDALQYKLNGLQKDLKVAHDKYVEFILLNIQQVESELQTLIQNKAEPLFFGSLNDADLNNIALDVEVMILKMAEFFQTDSTLLEGRSATILADQIVNTFHYLTIEDISVVINDALKGKMGNIYGKVNGPKVMEWIHNYEKRLIGNIDDYRANNYDSMKAQSSTPLRSGLTTFKRILKKNSK